MTARHWLRPNDPFALMSELRVETLSALPSNKAQTSTGRRVVIRHPSELTPEERQQMYRLMSDHFQNVDAQIRV